MNKKIMLIGAGGHANIAKEIIKLNGDTVVGFFDDNSEKFHNTSHYLGGICKISQYSDNKDIYFFCAIGNNLVRSKIMTEYKFINKWYTAIHPSAVVSKSATVGYGTLINACVAVNCNSIIGDGVILNTSSSVDHDCKINNYVHITPGTHLAGTVFVGENTFIGIGSSVSNNVNIGENIIIGAGSVVIHDLKESGTYVGMPVRKIK